MSKGWIPKDPAWCTRCIAEGSPCGDHRGPDGSVRSYRGSDAYEPSSWVLEVVGKRYKAWGGPYLCFGYDPRSGFWMRSEADGRETNVSEAAIDRTFHRIWEEVAR
jgi:hypothetical protein